jgi:hypothetical protein
MSYRFDTSGTFALAVTSHEKSTYEEARVKALLRRNESSMKAPLRRTGGSMKAL